VRGKLPACCGGGKQRTRQRTNCVPFRCGPHVAPTRPHPNHPICLVDGLCVLQLILPWRPSGAADMTFTFGKPFSIHSFNAQNLPLMCSVLAYRSWGSEQLSPPIDLFFLFRPVNSVLAAKAKDPRFKSHRRQTSSALSKRSESCVGNNSTIKIPAVKLHWLFNLIKRFLRPRDVCVGLLTSLVHVFFIVYIVEMLNMFYRNDADVTYIFPSRFSCTTVIIVVCDRLKL